jgi:hypothetical protein
VGEQRQLAWEQAVREELEILSEWAALSEPEASMFPCEKLSMNKRAPSQETEGEALQKCSQFFSNTISTGERRPIKKSGRNEGFLEAERKRFRWDG